MTLNAVTFFFNKDPELRSIRLIQAMQGPAQIPLRSERIATTGIAYIFQKLRTVNERMYQDAMAMDDFIVTLSPRAGSQNLGLKIEGKNLCINLEKLKPETRAILTNSLNPLQRDLLSNTGALRAEPIPPKTSIINTLLIPFMFMLSTFRNILNSLSSCISRPNKSADRADDSLRMENIEQPEILRPIEIPSSSLVLLEAENPDLEPPFFDLDAVGKAPPIYLENLDQKSRLARKLTKKREKESNKKMMTPVNKPPVVPASEVVSNKDKIVEEEFFEVLASELTDEKKLATVQIKHVIASDDVGFDEEEEVDSKKSLTEEESEKKIMTPVIKSPVLPASKVVSNKDKIIEEPKSIPAASTESPHSIYNTVTPEEIMRGTLESIIKVQFSDTTVTVPNGTIENFGAYFMNSIWGKIVSCDFNMETGEFTLTLEKGQKIPITKLPAGKSQAEITNLKMALGTTLCISKQIKGRIDIKGGKLVFNEGTVTIQWTQFFKTFTAHLLGIYPHQNTEWVVFTGKASVLGLEKTAEFAIKAQDFADLIECNLPKT